MSAVSSKRDSLHPCTCNMGAFQLLPSSLEVTVVISAEFEKVCHPSKVYFHSHLSCSPDRKNGWKMGMWPVLAEATLQFNVCHWLVLTTRLHGNITVFLTEYVITSCNWGSLDAKEKDGQGGGSLPHRDPSSLLTPLDGLFFTCDCTNPH